MEPRMGFSWRGTPPNNLSLLITSVSMEFSGTYTATATARKPSSTVDIQLRKVFAGMNYYVVIVINILMGC